MAISIQVNRLSLVHKGSGGVSQATLPDACLTPPSGAVVPYPNVARSRDLELGTRSVLVDGGNPAATARSRFAKSAGDEAGRLGGVVSGTVGREASFLSYSFDVKIEGHGASRLTDKMLHNRGNTIDCGGVTQKNVSARALAARRRAAAQKALELTVTVVDKATGKPIKNALVRVRGGGAAKRTDAAGKALFRRLARKKYPVEVIHSCYSDKATSKRVAKKHDELTVKLSATSLLQAGKKRGVKIGGRLTNGGWPNDVNTFHAEFGGGVIGTFWRSLCGAPPSAARYPFEDQAAELVKGILDRPGTTVKELEGTPLVWPLFKHPTPTVPDDNEWHPTPDWAGGLPDINTGTPEARRQAACKYVGDYIRRVVQAYSRVKRWVVVNEPMNLISREPTWEHPFWRAFGGSKVKTVRRRTSSGRIRKQKRRVLTEATKESILYCFREAHRHSPKAVLLLNDYTVEGWNGVNDGRRGQQYFELAQWIVKRLKRTTGKTKEQQKFDKGVLAKLGVGFQMHYPNSGELNSSGSSRASSDYSESAMRAQVARIRALKKGKGVPIYVTEMDVMVPALVRLQKRHKAAQGQADYYEKNRKDYEAAFRTQREETKKAIRALLSAGNLKGITWWSTVDAIEHDFRYHGYLFHQAIGCKPPPSHDKGHFRKPAYYGAVSALLERAKRAR